MPLSTLSADDLLNYWGANYGKYVSLHSAYSASGGNELSGGSYARYPATWGSAASNSMSLTGVPYSISVPSGATVEFIGFWDSLTGGGFHGMAPAGNLNAYTFTAPASTGVLLAPGTSYGANQTVVVLATGGSALPSGLTAGVVYYCVSVSTDTFKLSATTGGTGITLSSDGSGIVQGIAAESFGSAGTYQVTSGSWSLV